MTTRSAHNWENLPGNMDRLNASIIFDSDNQYGIPTIKKTDFVPDWIVPYGQRIRTDKRVEGGAVHTFIDDYRFEQLWNRIWDTTPVIQKIGGALSPDFSVYPEWPFALQLWNIYRSRWLGAFWQEKGIKVIPTVTWGDPKSFSFSFLGIERGSIVALSTVGVNRREQNRRLFELGFYEMISQVAPELILCYGETSPVDMENHVDVKWYPSYWKGIRDAMKENGDGR